MVSLCSARTGVVIVNASRFPPRPSKRPCAQLPRLHRPGGRAQEGPDAASPLPLGQVQSNIGSVQTLMLAYVRLPPPRGLRGASWVGPSRPRQHRMRCNGLLACCFDKPPAGRPGRANTCVAIGFNRFSRSRRMQQSWLIMRVLGGAHVKLKAGIVGFARVS